MAEREAASEEEAALADGRCEDTELSEALDFEWTTGGVDVEEPFARESFDFAGPTSEAVCFECRDAEEPAARESLDFVGPTSEAACFDCRDLAEPTEDSAAAKLKEDFMEAAA